MSEWDAFPTVGSEPRPQASARRAPQPRMQSPTFASDDDAIIRTVIGEARGESPEGRLAVASVIRNRANARRMTPTQVVLQQNQFEPWGNPETAAGLMRISPDDPLYREVAAQIQGADPTGGADHFYAPAAQRALGRDAPAWAAGQRPTVIGNHNFYNLSGAGADSSSFVDSYDDQGSDWSAFPEAHIDPPSGATVDDNGFIIAPDSDRWGTEQNPWTPETVGEDTRLGDYVRYTDESGQSALGRYRGSGERLGGNVIQQAGGPSVREMGALNNIGGFAQAASEQIPFLDESVAATTGLLTGRGYDEMRETQRQMAAADNATNRGSRVAGGLAGFGTSFLAPGAGFIGRGGSVADKASRAAVVGGGLGGLYGAGAAADGGLGNRLEAGTQGAAIGALAGGALQAGGIRLSELVAQRAANRATNPSNARILSNAGIDLLPGQVFGGGFRRMEDAATSIPFMGDAIRSAQRRGLEQLNDAALAEPLQRIGATVPQVRGRERIREVSQEFTRAYDNALDPLKAIPRPEGYTEALEAIANNPSLGPQQRRSMRSLIANTVGKAGDEIDGQTWKRIDSELSADINNASRAATNAPENRLLGDALRQVRDVWGQRLDAAAPGALATVRNIDDAFADFAIVRKAVSDVASAGRGGEASAATLNRAVSQSAGGNRYAQGMGRLQELSDAAANVLPSTVPDSGTPLRSLVTAGGLGGGAVALGNPMGQLAAGVAATGVGAGTAAYSRPALNLFNRLYRATGQDSVSRNLSGMLDAPAQNPAAVPLWLELLQGDANNQPVAARR